MGTIYKAACPKCEYEEEFYLGGGLMSIDLLCNLRFLDRVEQDEIRKMKSEGNISNFVVENKLTACIHCDALRGVKKRR